MSAHIAAYCKCKQVEFQSTKPPLIQLCCHCQDCRDAFRTDYASLAFFRADFCQVSGDVVEHGFIADSGNKTAREACSQCGTVMFDKSEGFPQLIGVLTSQIAPPFEAKPTHHVWVSRKLPDIVIPEDALQFEKGLPPR